MTITTDNLFLPVLLVNSVVRRFVVLFFTNYDDFFITFSNVEEMTILLGVVWRIASFVKVIMVVDVYSDVLIDDWLVHRLSYLRITPNSSVVVWGHLV